MTIYKHITNHDLNCDCSYCQDVDPTKSISFELEKYCEELMRFGFTELTEEQAIKVYELTGKILLLRRYFPEKELPSKHARLIEEFYETCFD